MMPAFNPEIPVMLDLTAFSIHGKFRSVGPHKLYLDRANGEVGVVKSEDFSVLVMAEYPNDEPLSFRLQNTCAVAFRSRCKKVSLLFKHLQLDLEFASTDLARQCLLMTEHLANNPANFAFCSYEVPSGVRFAQEDFDMVKLGYTGYDVQTRAMGNTNSEWPDLLMSGEWSDFTIVAQGVEFAVHRIKLCRESAYFKAACTNGFLEAAAQKIELPESAAVIANLIHEMYGAGNFVTGSMFTNFLLGRSLEMRRNLTQLVDLYVACDKYSLDNAKHKVSMAIIDRLPFVQDSLTIIDFAANVFHPEFPAADGGLREAVITKVAARLPVIVEDETAWEELYDNKAVVKALQLHQCGKKEE